MTSHPSRRSAVTAQRTGFPPGGSPSARAAPARTAEAASGAPAANPALKTILICEDESSLRELVRAVLGPGFRYAEASDGVEALELARSVAPDLIVLDLMLPRASGLEVLEALRGDPRTSMIPVVVLSAWSHFEEPARSAGADRFVAKPFEPSELQAVVRELLFAS